MKLKFARSCPVCHFTDNYIYIAVNWQNVVVDLFDRMIDSNLSLPDVVVDCLHQVVECTRWRPLQSCDFSVSRKRKKKFYRLLNSPKSNLGCLSENVANYAIFRAALRVTDAVLAGDMAPAGTTLVTPDVGIKARKKNNV